MKRVTLVALILSLLLLSQCRGKSSDSTKININFTDVSDDSTPWYLVSYGEHAVKIDTLKMNEKGRIKFSRTLNLDTIDFMLLLNSSLLLEMPLIPNREQDINIEVRPNKREAQGIISPDSVLKWRTLIDSAGEKISGELLDFLEHYDTDQTSLLLTLDAVQRYGEGSCKNELSLLLERRVQQFGDISKALGIGNLPALYDATNFSYWIDISGKEERLETKKLLGKKPLFAFSILSFQDRDSTKINALKNFYSELDSLGVPSYTVLLSDSLPNGISVKKGTNFRYFLIDSIGEATRFIQQKQIQQIPSYQLVDSTLQVWRVWDRPDSLISFVKQFNSTKENNQ